MWTNNVDDWIYLHNHFHSSPWDLNYLNMIVLYADVCVCLSPDSHSIRSISNVYTDMSLGHHNCDFVMGIYKTYTFLCILLGDVVPDWHLRAYVSKIKDMLHYVIYLYDVVCVAPVLSEIVWINMMMNKHTHANTPTENIFTSLSLVIMNWASKSKENDSPVRSS